MRSRALPIAANTFREAMRDRIFSGIAAFAVFFVLLTIFLGKLSLGDLLMIRSFGLAGVYVFGLLTTIFLGSSVLHTEIERRTLYFVLSKPVSRFDVVLGKFLGLSGAALAALSLMTAVYLGVVWFEGGGFDLWGLAAIGLQAIELVLFTAFLVALSAVTAPLVAVVSATLLVFVGHLLGPALQEARTIGGATEALLKALYYVLPNLEKFNIRNLVVHDVALPPIIFVQTVAYGLLYAALLLVLANWLFEKREL